MGKGKVRSKTDLCNRASKKLRSWNGIIVVERVIAESFQGANQSLRGCPAPKGDEAISDERFRNLWNKK